MKIYLAAILLTAATLFNAQIHVIDWHPDSLFASYKVKSLRFLHLEDSVKASDWVTDIYFNSSGRKKKAHEHSTDVKEETCYTSWYGFAKEGNLTTIAYLDSRQWDSAHSFQYPITYSYNRKGQLISIKTFHENVIPDYLIRFSYKKKYDTLIRYSNNYFPFEEKAFIHKGKVYRAEHFFVTNRSDLADEFSYYRYNSVINVSEDTLCKIFPMQKNELMKDIRSSKNVSSHLRYDKQNKLSYALIVINDARGLPQKVYEARQTDSENVWRLEYLTE